MKFKFTWGRKFVACILLAAVVLGNIAAPAEVQAKTNGGKNTVAVVQADNYRRTLSKGFLGKRYGTVIDGIRCDCSGYTRAALNRLTSEGKNGSALKNVQLNAHCTRDWVNGSSISYTTGVATNGAVKWNDRTVLSIGKKSTGASKVENLNLGDVVVYGKGSSTTHIAVYFGKFSSIDEVKEYLEDIGVYKKGELKKSGSTGYTDSGRTVIRKYTESAYWRIHSTNSGIMIDNDIAGTSRYTSSFGSWKWTFETGIQVNE